MAKVTMKDERTRHQKRTRDLIQARAESIEQISFFYTDAFELFKGAMRRPTRHATRDIITSKKQNMNVFDVTGIILRKERGSQRLHSLILYIYIYGMHTSLTAKHYTTYSTHDSDGPPPLHHGEQISA
jgi:hypothetical protein